MSYVQRITSFTHPAVAHPARTANANAAQLPPDRVQERDPQPALITAGAIAAAVIVPGAAEVEAAGGIAVAARAGAQLLAEAAGPLAAAAGRAAGTALKSGAQGIIASRIGDAIASDERIPKPVRDGVHAASAALDTLLSFGRRS